MDSVASSKNASKKTKKPLVIEVPRLSAQEVAAEELMELQGMANPDSYGLVLEQLRYGTDHRVDAIVFSRSDKHALTDYDPLDIENAEYEEINGYLRYAGYSEEDSLRGIDWDEYEERVIRNHRDEDWELDEDVDTSLLYGDGEDDWDEQPAQLSNAA